MRVKSLSGGGTPILNNLKTLWPKLDSKAKKEISSKLYKIKEKVNYE